MRVKDGDGEAKVCLVFMRDVNVHAEDIRAVRGQRTLSLLQQRSASEESVFRLSCVNCQRERDCRLRHGSCSECLSELSDFRRRLSSMSYCSAVKDLSLDT